jgi:uncharacterized membrane protein
MPTMPLHPIIVHFPIAIGMIAPLLILLIWMGIHRWSWPMRTWSIVVLVNLILVVSSVAALKTGEQDEDKVESYVTKQAFEDHEELGEKLPWLFAALMVVSAIPFVIPKQKKLFMTATLILSSASIAPIVVVGHTGGKLVYEQGAANAHTKNLNIQAPVEDD